MIRPTDFTHPNPPDDIPQKKPMEGSPLLNMATQALFTVPWPRKPIGKLKSKARPVRRSKTKHRKYT